MNLADLKAQEYRIGNCQAIRYDRERADLFYEGWLAHLYERFLESGRRDPHSWITALFGGNPPSHFDAILPFLASRPLIILGIWKEQTFEPAGICFPLLFCGSQHTELAAFCGFGFFRQYYGTDEIHTLSILGLAHLYGELNLVAIHGTRFPDNTLAARFMEQFGFRDIGELPHYQLRGVKLVPTIISTCSRAKFEEVLAGWDAGESAAEERPEETREYRTVEEAPLRMLVAGEVKAVWFPPETREVPPLPEGMQATIVDGGFIGDGVWYFNPAMLREIEIWVECGNSRHAELLSPVAKKQETPATSPKMVTLKAVRADGSLVTRVTVEATAEAIEHAVADFSHFKVSVDHDELKPEEKPIKPGSKGGKAKAAKMSREERREQARKMAQARWKKD